jgi:hypothetical protein
VGIARRWQARTDIQKLANTPLASQVPYRSGQKGTVRPGVGHYLRTAGSDFLSGLAVGGVRILPPKPYGIDPGRVREPGIKPQGSRIGGRASG